MKTILVLGMFMLSAMAFADPPPTDTGLSKVRERIDREYGLELVKWEEDFSRASCDLVALHIFEKRPSASYRGADYDKLPKEDQSYLRALTYQWTLQAIENLYEYRLMMCHSEVAANYFMKSLESTKYEREESLRHLLKMKHSEEPQWWLTDDAKMDPKGK